MFVAGLLGNSRNRRTGKAVGQSSRARRAHCPVSKAKAMICGTRAAGKTAQCPPGPLLLLGLGSRGGDAWRRPCIACAQYEDAGQGRAGQGRAGQGPYSHAAAEAREGETPPP